MLLLPLADLVNAGRDDVLKTRIKLFNYLKCTICVMNSLLKTGGKKIPSFVS